MARTVDQIVTQQDEQLATKTSLTSIISNPSQTAIWKDFRHAIAVVIAVLEQLMDEFMTEMDAKIDANIVGTYPWLKQKLTEFQYDSSTPQVIELIDNIPQYAVVDESKRLLTVAVVRYTSANIPYIYVAKNNPPEKLTNTEKTAVQGYLTDGGTNSAYGVGIGMAGIKYEVYTLDPDLLFIEGVVKYDGNLASTIQDTVEGVIQDYLYYGLNAKGYLVLNDLIKLVKEIDGVIDFEVENMAIRTAAQSFGTGTPIVTNFEVIVFNVQALAGYAIQETDTGNTWGDKITYTATY